MASLEARAGFLRVFRALGAARRPLVGHNCLYDLLFLFSHFHAPLPDTLLELKRAISALLPAVWDTKHLAAASEQYSDTGLGPLHAACIAQEEAPTLRLEHGIQRPLEFTSLAPGHC